MAQGQGSGVHGVDPNEAQDNARKGSKQSKVATIHGVTAAEAQQSALENSLYQ